MRAGAEARLRAAVRVARQPLPVGPAFVCARFRSFSLAFVRLCALRSFTLGFVRLRAVGGRGLNGAPALGPGRGARGIHPA